MNRSVHPDINFFEHSEQRRFDTSEIRLAFLQDPSSWRLHGENFSGVNYGATTKARMIQGNLNANNESMKEKVDSFRPEELLRIEIGDDSSGWSSTELVGSDEIRKSFDESVETGQCAATIESMATFGVTPTKFDVSV